MAFALADPALHTVTGGRPASTDELRERYTRQLRGPDDPHEEWCTWVVRDGDDGPLVGFVQATLTGDGACAELAWVVGTPWQGRGIARRAAALVLAEVTRRGVGTVVAHVRPGHAPSEAVARSLGMGPTDVVVDGETRWSLEVPGR
ncbi:GNAT family N-acetyltransferase [Arthrobacter sp. NEB 688]|nr:GNAT family N-acetyltransferase [Arthrobacter sp. NEB 688]